MFERVRRGNRLTITVAKPVAIAPEALVPVPPPPAREKQRVAFDITRNGNRTTYRPIVVG